MAAGLRERRPVGAIAIAVSTRDGLVYFQTFDGPETAPTSAPCVTSPRDAFDALRDGLDAIAADLEATVATIRAIWRLLGAIGFTPALDACVHCDRALPVTLDVAFSAEAGGVLCETCAARVPSRRLPASARQQIRAWLEGGEISSDVMDLPTERAHRRLLRIFVHAHVTDGRPLRAFDAWATA